MKLCSKCKIEQDFSQFTRRSDKPHLWRSHCKSCIKIKNKKAYDKDAENRREYSRNYRKNNPEQTKASVANWRSQRTPEQRKEFSEYLRNWRKNNPYKIKSYRQAQRAKRESAFVERVPFEMVWNRDKGVCQLCGKDIDPNVKYPNWDCATLDHIFPISKGGKHQMTNVQLACWGCNFKKRDKILER